MANSTSCRWILALGAAIVVAGCTVPEESTTAPAGPEPARIEYDDSWWQDEYGQMVSTLDLTLDQEDALRTAFEERDRALAEWLNGPEGQKLYAQEERLKDAVNARDLRAVRDVTRGGPNMRVAFGKQIEAADQRILDVLTEDQQQTWQGHLLAEKFLELSAPVQLSFEQQTQIRFQAPRMYAGMLARSEPNPQAAGFLALEKWAEANVFTPEQRAAYAVVKSENPLRSLTQ
jgi:Spy/CpxP family protein refolding chaperone